ncbi:AcrR family transcriptional regulator [Actinoplanes octamycinicus]|uniref:AcrR family transcriptional regulator n=1 Tax=Actinoplanes octamycinicus TaxID=135948 RepID=A0A7W7H475_9ACTN|nr:TetR/AcrR family transcriptional regulator [Actinoplanes octamycinicus]MBB4743577.1 AcrR family transcriptional regulator [Actinoplanes octamycinicus]GIE62433.1 TetR family transcriptional regulator [Actinoplanes octamycinicus]
MSPRREPVSRRDRPAKPALSRAGAVAVALRIMREEGLERLTMRRLAAELDTGPASLYVYVQNMAELHGAILDELLAELTLPPVDADRWRDRLVALMCDYTRLLMAWPSLARSVLTLRPSGPHYVRLIDTVLGLLRAGGVPATQAAWGLDLLLQLGTATAAEQGTRGEAKDADREQEMLVMALREAPEPEFPHVARVRDELFSGTGEERLAWAFTVLTAGIQAVPK